MLFLYILFYIIAPILAGYVTAKLCERALRSDKPKQLDYDKRWSDTDYVVNVHKTMLLEQQMGIEPTQCFCPRHKPVIKMVPASHGPAGIGDSKLAERHVINLFLTPNEWRLSGAEWHYDVVDGYGNVITRRTYPYPQEQSK